MLTTAERIATVRAAPNVFPNPRRFIDPPFCGGSLLDLVVGVAELVAPRRQILVADLFFRRFPECLQSRRSAAMGSWSDVDRPGRTNARGRERVYRAYGGHQRRGTPEAEGRMSRERFLSAWRGSRATTASGSSGD